MERIGRGIQYGFGIIMILVLISCVMRGCDSYGLTVGIAVIAVGAAAYMLAAYKLAQTAEKRLKNIGAQSADRAFFVAACVMFAVQLYFGYRLSFSPITDLGYTDRAARAFCINWSAADIYDSLPARHKNYFAIYPNNQTLMIILALIYKAQYTMTGEMTRAAPIFLNAAALNTSYIFMYKCARLIYKEDEGCARPLFTAMCGAAFSVFYTYVPFYYTDSLSMPFVTLSLYKFLKGHERICLREIKGAAAELAQCALFTAAGFQIKGSVIVLLPAYALFIIVYKYGMERAAAKKAVVISSLAAAVILFTAVFSCIQGMFHIAGEEDYERYKFPAVHWIMMGMKSRGGYSYTDFNYTLSFETYDERVAADVARYAERLENFGIGGSVFHFFKKAAYTWADGAYLIHYHIGGESDSALKSFITRSPAFRYMCSFYHFAMLAAITAGFFRAATSKKGADKLWLLRIVFVGIFLFLELWETRSRYLVNFTPIFIILAADFFSGKIKEK